jgi:hypothetical protein
MITEGEIFAAQISRSEKESVGTDGGNSGAAQQEKKNPVDLRGMLQALTQHHFDGHPLSDIEQYQAHVDSVAGGLFSLFLSAIPKQSAETKTKVAMLLGLFGHMVDPNYSQVVWELTTALHSSEVSDRQLRGLSAKGLVMCTSKVHAHERLMQERHDLSVSRLCGDAESGLMLVADDFHQIESSHGLPRKKKREVLSGA